MRTIPAILAVLLAGLTLAPRAFAADTTTVHAILLVASNAKAPADPRLAAYEAQLQRNIPESSFRFVAEGTASVSSGGHARLSLGHEHRLELERDRTDGSVRLKVQWLNGDSVVLSTSLANLQPGVPALLGRRPSGDGEVPIVLVMVR